MLGRRLYPLLLLGALVAPSNSSALSAAHRTSLPLAGGSVAQSLVSTALQYVGSPYAVNGDTPELGFSSGGFVHWVFSRYGYNTPEEPGAIYAAYPHLRSGNQMAGVVLLFANTGQPGISHAAISLGNGRMIGSDSITAGVHIDPTRDRYWRPRYVGAVRILPDAGGGR